MPEMVASRALRRRHPGPDAWAAVAWSDPVALCTGGGRWQGSACAGILACLLALGGLRLVQTDSVAPVPDAPVWLDLPPSDPQAAQPLPPPPSAPDALRAPEPLAAPIALAAVPEAPVHPEPAFGLDDAVETGGLAVASGSTLVREPDPVARTPEAPSGPVYVASVPGSVRPVVPVYPPRAEELGLETRVVAVVTTDTLGNVADVRIERSGGREFDHSVRRAILSTRFYVPRRADGRGQAVAFRLPYDFRLE